MSMGSLSEIGPPEKKESGNVKNVVISNENANGSSLSLVLVSSSTHCPHSLFGRCYRSLLSLSCILASHKGIKHTHAAKESENESERARGQSSLLFPQNISEASTPARRESNFRLPLSFFLGCISYIPTDDSRSLCLISGPMIKTSRYDEMKRR